MGRFLRGRAYCKEDVELMNWGLRTRFSSGRAPCFSHLCFDWLATWNAVGGGHCMRATLYEATYFMRDTLNDATSPYDIRCHNYATYPARF